MSSLFQINEKFQQLKVLLENGDIDEQTFQDTISCIEVDFTEKAENYCKMIAEWQGEILTVKAEQDRLSDLAKRLSNSMQKLKDNLMLTMENQAKTSVKAGTYDIKIKLNPPSVNILDEALIDKIYFVEKPAELSKKLISEALKKGEIVAGAELVSKQSLTIK
jgi:hypothetical protein